MFREHDYAQSSGILNLSSFEIDVDDLKGAAGVGPLGSCSRLVLSSFTDLTDMRFIPACVTTLEIRGCTSVDYFSIPRSVRELVICCDELSSTKDLPSGLDTLIVQSKSEESFSIMDTDAKKIEIQHRKTDILNLSDRTEQIDLSELGDAITLGKLTHLNIRRAGEFDLSLIPVSLHHLRIGRCRRMYGKYVGNVINYSGQDHFAFNTVRAIDCSSHGDLNRYTMLVTAAISIETPFVFSGPIKDTLRRLILSTASNIPDLTGLHITTLKLISACATHFPVSLMRLELDLSGDIAEDLTYLVNLRNIKISGYDYTRATIVLPEGILQLDASVFDFFETNLPTSLVSIEMKHIEKIHFTTPIPRALTSIPSGVVC